MTLSEAKDNAINYLLGYLAGLENVSEAKNAHEVAETVEGILQAAVVSDARTRREQAREQDARANKGIRGCLEDLVYEAMPRYGNRVRELDERGRERFFARVEMALAAEVSVAINREERHAREYAREQALADRILDAISDGRERDERPREQDA